jgi:hypothetical protein
MNCIAKLISAAALVCATAIAAQADNSRGTITDQRYHSGKYSGGQHVVLANCPREYREMYRGDLYCRKPERQVLAYRHAACPKEIWGLYRGNMYCFGRR